MTQIYNKKSILERRRGLRLSQTDTERMLWEKLRYKRLGVKFRRQFSIGGYVLDFCCPQKKVGIEIDGLVHRRTVEYDRIRDKILEELGYKILRFTNRQVINNVEDVVRMIKSETRN